MDKAYYGFARWGFFRWDVAKPLFDEAVDGLEKKTPPSFATVVSQIEKVNIPIDTARSATWDNPATVWDGPDLNDKWDYTVLGFFKNIVEEYEKW